MKFSLIIGLIVALSLPALAFDREKLMKLDPLPSVRLQRIGVNAENNKLFWTAGWGLSGGWLIYNNLNKGYDAYRVNNLLSGSTLMVTAALKYMLPSSFKTDQALFKELDFQGVEKETNAYFSIKSNAKSGQIQRRAAALMYLLSSLGSAVLAGSSTNLSDDERSWTNANAIGFFGLALYQFFVPGADEIAADQLDRELTQ